MDAMDIKDIKDILTTGTIREKKQTSLIVGYYYLSLIITCFLLFPPSYLLTAAYCLFGSAVE